MEWSALVETKAPEGPRDDEFVLDRLGDFLDKLADADGAVSGDGRGWDARISVDTSDGPGAAVEAVERAVEVVQAAADAVGLPAWPIIRAEAVEVDTFHNELEVRNFPEMLGTTEVKRVLGVSRQRLHELRSQGRFPKPVTEVAATPLWVRATVDSFLAGWERKPGRPRTVVQDVV